MNNKTTNARLGRNIRAFMRANGINQSFVAERLGVTESTLSRILSGNRKLTAVEYFNLCDAVRVDLSYFWEEIKEGASNEHATI